ncbi:hypothetical protein ACFLY8_00700 [Halobacteriota archaeon]
MTTVEKRNLFSPTFPVNPRYFTGREDILSSFRTAFGRSIKTEMPTPDNIAILGDAGIGKTSILRKFESIALEEFKDRKVFSAIVELTPTSFSSIFSKVVEDISGNFITNTTVSTEIKNEIRNWRIESINKRRSEPEQSGKDASTFRIAKEVFMDLWKIIEKIGVDTAILMFDDAHYISNLYPDFLNNTAKLFQNLPRYGCNFILCIAGRSDIFSNAKDSDWTFASFFNIKHNLNPFNLNETRESLLTSLKLSGLDLKIDEDVIEKIYYLTAGYLPFINFIMRELVSLNPKGRINLRFFEENYLYIIKSMERERFRSDFSIASHKEKSVLLALSKLSDMFSPSDIDVKNARTQLRFLIKKGLIVKHDRGRYSLYHPLFKEYLRNLGENE